MRKHYYFLFILVGMMTYLPLNGQKFGYINTQLLIEEIPEVQEANSNIETFRNQLQKKGKEMLLSLQEKAKELEQKQAQGDISPKQLDIEAQKLKEEEQTILLFEQESQSKLLKKSEDLLKPLRDKIQNAIDEVAKEDNYDYIFDYGAGFVLYAEEGTDVSAKVKAKLKL